MKKDEKNKKNTKKQQKKEKNPRSKGAFACFITLGAVAVVCLFVCQFLLSNSITANTTLLENTKINGIDVSNMTMPEAENVVLSDMLSNLNTVEIKLNYDGQQWVLQGTDFEVANQIEPHIKEVVKDEKSGNFFENMQKAKDIEKNGADYKISYKYIISNLERRVDSVIEKIEQPVKEPSLVFAPERENPFYIDKGKVGVKVDREELFALIDKQLMDGEVVEVDVPVERIEPEISEEQLKDSIVKRSEFSTNYANSSADRKNNIKRAIESFNGMIVEGGEQISFNKTTGARTEENGYKNAHIIINGVYVDGIGGGVCQASTTLYNALLLGGMQIDEVYHHTLPSSYVPLSFDSMVSEDYADLVFTNPLDTPIYILTKADGKSVKVEIYGEKSDTKIERHSEIVKILPHNGDKVVPDTDGKYEDKVLYKGEYYRIKWPKEGYESKGYLRYYDGEELVDEKEIRHDFYEAQDGVVVEGADELGEGMTLPNTSFSIVSPQKLTKERIDAIKAKLAKEFPKEYAN